MSIINHSKNFIFVHVPKAAGTSVTKTLSSYTTYKDLEIGGTHFGELIQPGYSRRFGLAKHTPASGIREVIGKEAWDEAFTFSIVRDPYERVISTYKFLLNWDGTPKEIKERISKFKSIDDYIASDIWEESAGPDFIFKPQTFWLTDVNDRSKLIVDHVGKLENIDNEIAYIRSRIEGRDVSPIETPKLNETEGMFELSNNSIDKINKFYTRDFNFFNYNKK